MLLVLKTDCAEMVTGIKGHCIVLLDSLMEQLTEVLGVPGRTRSRWTMWSWTPAAACLTTMEARIMLCHWSGHPQNSRFLNGVRPPFRQPRVNASRYVTYLSLGM